MAFTADSRGFLRCLPLEGFEWLAHGFGTRHSPPPAEGLPVASVRQVHSARSLVVDHHAGCAGEADALITATPGQLVSVRTADCLPVLIADERRRVVAAVHAGWRGTAADICGEVIRRLRREFGSEPEDLLVAIGPGIGKCCYEVGPEVAARFTALLPELGRPVGRAQLDLVEATRRLIARQGVPEERVYSGAPCTFCHPVDFYSYRREPSVHGRMVSLIGIRR